MKRAIALEVPANPASLPVPSRVVCGACGKRREQGRHLDQSAAACQRVDEARAERGDQHQQDLERHGAVAEGAGTGRGQPRREPQSVQAGRLRAAGQVEPESYQCSISRNETDCGGGRPGKPAAISSRVNQRTSSSSSSARGTDVCRGRAPCSRSSATTGTATVATSGRSTRAPSRRSPRAPRAPRRPRGSRPARRIPRSSNNGPRATTPGGRAARARRR